MVRFTIGFCTKKSRNGTTTKYPGLPDNQIKLLDDIGFEWESELYDTLWMAKYKELVDFRSKHGHLEVEHGDPVIHGWTHSEVDVLGRGVALLS